LEAALGVTLLTRTTRALALTEAGEQLLPMARQVLETQQQVQDWQDGQRAEPRGHLRLTAPGSFGRGPLTDWLTTYRLKYPQVTVELIHSNDYLDFQTHRLDGAFRQGPLPDSNLIATRLFGIQYGVFASPEWIAKNETISEPAQFQQIPVLSAGAKGRSLPWRFKDQSITPKQVIMLFDDMPQCLTAAAAGLGPTFAGFYEATPFLTSGQLVELMPEQRSVPADFYLVSPWRAHQSLKSESFLTHIQQEISDFGPQPGLILSP
jgi:DNA-binding transcriptional LysR family regulator